MKAHKKVIYVIMFIICILLFTTKIYAATDTNTTLSSNTELTTLGIKPAKYDFKGFKNSVSAYSTKVPESVEEIEIFATTKDKKSKVEGIGKRKLEIGKNILEVSVTAEDGTKKTFTISVIRGEDTVRNGNIEGIKSLTIQDAKLSPEFQPTIYEYTAKYIGEATKLEITAEPAVAGYVVEVTGNKDLQEGENIITILVSDETGGNIATYQITVNKSLVDTEAIERQEAEEKEKKQKIIMYFGIACVITFFLVILIMVIVKCKKKKNTSEYENDYEENNGKKRKNGKRFK